MSTDALHLFFSSATQYYVTGRFAVLSGQSPVAGNLFHHAIEMYLKGGLAKTTTLQGLKRLGHSLPKVWSAFKTSFPTSDLDSFDQLVLSLDAFEELRYPDSALAQGMHVDLGVVRPTFTVSPSVRPEPKYALYLNELDALVSKVFETVPANPEFFFAALMPRGREYLTDSNAEPWARDGPHPAPTTRVPNKKTIVDVLPRGESDQQQSSERPMTKQEEAAVGAQTSRSLPNGYRQSIVTAITVFLGFSMAFLRFWGIENPGDWTPRAVLSELVVGVGVVFQLAALFRALDVRDDDPTRYRTTVRVFTIGVLVVLVGVVASILVAASGDGATSTPTAG